VEITRELVLPAPPEEVWEALTDAGRLAEWFANDVDLDPRPGGRGLFRWDDGETRTVLVEEVDPPRRFGFRWTDRAADGEVAFELEEVSEGTRVTVRETTADPQACAGAFALAVELQLLFVPLVTA
jgi:uncharacterized protein YndB with AHSA1/START domain